MTAHGTSGRFATDPNQWPTVKAEHVPASKKEKFDNRSGAIKALHKGTSYRSIHASFGIHAKELNRFIKRCQELHSDGQLWGFRVLIDRTFLEDVERSIEPSAKHLRNGTGAKALFQQLLSDHEELNTLLLSQARALLRSQTTGKRVRIADLHFDFVAECKRVLNNDLTRYPLCLRYQGKEGYKGALLKERRRLEGEDEPELSPIAKVLASRLRPYSDVELDAHRLDAQIKIKVSLPTGGTKKQLIDRLCVIVARDRESRSILAWLLVVGKEIDHLDLLRCIRKISAPWEPRQLCIPGLTYFEGSGFPSGVIAHCAGRMAEIIHLDNAMAHLAHNVRAALMKSIGCTVNWGRAGEPDERAIIETFFKALTEGSIQQLPVGFTKAKESLKLAIKEADFSSPSIQEMEDYLDVVLSAMNIADATALYGETPFDRLRREDPRDLFRADVSDDAPWRRLTRVRRTFRIVRDGEHSAHANFLDEDYISASFPSMLRRGITSFEGEVELEDLRKLFPIPIHGWQPDVAEVKGEWRRFPHDIRLRRIINREIRTKRFRFDPQREPLAHFKEHLAQRAAEDRTAATDVARMDTSPSEKKTASKRAPSSRPGKPRKVARISKLGSLFSVDLSRKKG